MKHFSKAKYFLLILSFAIIILCSACGEKTPHPEDEILSYTLASDPLTLDPQIADDESSQMLITNLFEGLVRISSDGNIKSGMAESWDISQDGKTYIFHLFEDTQWSSGTPVTADDFVFGLTRTLSPETRSPSAADLFIIKNASSFYKGETDSDNLGIKAIDEHTLQIDLEYSSDSFLNLLTEPAAMPCSEEFFRAAKGKYGKSEELTITNGPFRIRENYGWDHDKYIYIRRNENYKAANKAIPLGVNFNYGSQPDDPVSSILSGENDICEINGNNLSSAEENNFNITTTSNTLWGICYNTDIAAFKNAKLRVSLLSSLNRKRLLRGSPKSYVKTSQLIGNDVLFEGKNYRELAGNFEIQQEENAAAIYSKALEELSEKNIEVKSSYTILYLDDESSSKIVTSVIESWNKTSGCYFNKQPLSRNELDSRIKSGDYEIAIAPLNTAEVSPMEFLSRFRTGSPDNYINLNYPQYNEFIDTALSENGDNSLNSLVKAEQYLIDYGYLYPLYYENRYFASADFVSGAIFSKTGGSIDFSQVTKLSKD